MAKTTRRKGKNTLTQTAEMLERRRQRAELQRARREQQVITRLSRTVAANVKKLDDALFELAGVLAERAGYELQPLARKTGTEG